MQRAILRTKNLLSPKKFIAWILFIMETVVLIIIYSDQNYLDQACANLVADMFAEAGNNNRNFGLQFKLNAEDLGTYRTMIFWGNTSNTPSGKKPYLAVNYTASKCDVFTSYVNNELQTHMTPQQVMGLYGRCNINTGLCSQVMPAEQDTLLLCGKTNPPLLH